MKLILTAAFLLSVSLCSVPRMYAHHSFAAEFDASKPITLTGTVTKVAWENPHAWFWIDVKDSNGNTANWGFECGAPVVLFKQEWKKGTLKPGDVITVTGFLAKSGANVAAAQTVTLPDGRKVMGGAGAPGEPTPDSGQAGKESK